MLGSGGVFYATITVIVMLTVVTEVDSRCGCHTPTPAPTLAPTTPTPAPTPAPTTPTPAPTPAPTTPTPAPTTPAPTPAPTTPTPVNPVCLLTKEQGPCNSSFKRWFYKNNTNACDVFIYGGCQGNGNNFVTEVACNTTCLNSNKK